MNRTWPTTHGANDTARRPVACASFVLLDFCSSGLMPQGLTAAMGDRSRFVCCLLAAVLGTLLIAAAPAANAPDLLAEAAVAHPPPVDTLEARPDTLRLPPPDTTEVPRADTLGIPPVTLELPAADTTTADVPEAAPPRPPPTGPPVGFLTPPPGLSPDSLKPARRAAFEAKDLLREVPGSFTYDLGGFGWPHGWTPDGQPPEAVRLTLSTVPFNDLITGRPRFDLLMLPLLEPLSVTSGRLGAATTVQAHFRDIEAPEPLTELQYATGGTGLQSITALHAQERDVNLPRAREEGRISVLFGYGGHAADNEYSNARLERMRQTLARVRLAQRTWSLELRNLHNRRSRGAHGGVVPAVGQPFNAIFVRPIATVDNTSAQDRTLRNDLAATLRLRTPLAAEAHPLTLTSYWTSQTYRYRSSADTLEARVNRYGVQALQERSVRGHDLRLTVDAWTDAVDDARGFAEAAPTRQRLHVELRDAVTLAGVDLEATAGLHAGAGLEPAATLRATTGLAGFTFTGEAAFVPVERSRIMASGFGEAFRAAPADTPTPRARRGLLRAATTFGPFDVAVFGRYLERRNALDIMTEPISQGELEANPFDAFFPDAAEVVRGPSPYRQVSGGLELGFRRTADRGFYATAQPTAFAFLNTTASPAHNRVAQSLPPAYAEARLGARYLLFEDLDTDISLRGRAWAPFSSRTLHEPTGTFAIPQQGSPTFGPEGALDIVIEAGLRGATLFLVWENALSGTDVTPGNLLVPLYPLPEQRLRFSVFWPITG